MRTGLSVAHPSIYTYQMQLTQKSFLSILFLIKQKMSAIPRSFQFSFF